VGLQATSTEAVVPKAGAGKKKGKKGAPKHRSIKLTNTHLNGVVDLSRDFVPPGKS
jgi:transcription initiation factor TFIIE subunit beta